MAMHGTGPEMDDYNFGGQAPLKGSCITSAVAYVLDQLERSELSNAQYIDEDGADAESDVLWFYGHGQPELERAVLKRVVELARAGVTNHNWRVRPMSTSKRKAGREGAAGMGFASQRCDVADARGGAP